MNLLWNNFWNNCMLRDFNYIVFLCVTEFRDKNNLPQFTVVYSSINTLCYHMGTVAKGSFIITLVKIPRIILTYIHTQLKGKVSHKPL